MAFWESWFSLAKGQVDLKKGIGLSNSWKFSGPDASMDRCKDCDHPRKSHEDKGHKFRED